MYDGLIYITVGGLIIKAKKTTALYLTPKRKTSKFNINYINPMRLKVSTLMMTTLML